MPSSGLSSLDIRAYFRTCHALLKDKSSIDLWTAYQKQLLMSSQCEFGVYTRQLKKVPPELWAELADGFSAGQVESKIWLVETLQDVLPQIPMRVHVLGSWFGLLPRMLFWMLPQRIEAAIGYDIDPRWSQITRSLNEPESYLGKMQFQTQDMYKLSYEDLLRKKSSLIINTSCEHLEDFPRWYSAIPEGTLLVLQGNNFVEPSEHHHVWSDLLSFKSEAPMQTLLFEGVLNLQKYDRFMLIGVK